MPKGQCHCGAVRYETSGDPVYHAVCHCHDCRRATGSPLVSWALFAAGQVAIEGETKTYASSEHGRRLFCAECGSSLFYTNEIVFPGMIDVQTGTLDDPDFQPAGVQVQTAERIGWVAKLHELPEFERYPEMP
jgi:hypothetical protein